MKDRDQGSGISAAATPYKETAWYLFAAMGDAAWSRVVRGRDLEKCIVEAIIGKDEPDPLSDDVVAGTIEHLGDPDAWGGFDGVDYWNCNFEDSRLHVVMISDEISKEFIGRAVRGLYLIGEERRRQVDEEGWSAEHDDLHMEGELAMAAALYAAPDPLFTFSDDGEEVDPWPWPAECDKREKHPRIRQLVISGALIAAEIDRLLRLQAGDATEDDTDKHG